MAKRKKIARSAPKQLGPRTPSPPDLMKIVAPLLAIVLAAIPFAYGKYYELGTNGAFDGGMNVYTAQTIVNGGKLGTDVARFASPATLLTNVVGVWLCGFSELGPKLIQTLMQIGALALMFYTLRKFYGAFAAVFSVVMAAFFLSCPPYCKFGNVKEQFMIACMVGAACSLMLRHAGGAKLWLILAGALAANSYFYKQTGASITIAMLIYLIAQPLFRHRTWRQFFSDVLLILAGALIGLIPLMAFSAWQTSVLDFIKEIPGLGFIINWAQSGQAAASLGGEYVGGSRQVTSFADQYVQVVGHYRSFIIPIGLCMLALGWRLVLFVRQIIARLRQNSSDTAAAISRESTAALPPTDKPDPSVLADRFVLLLGLWWLIDMGFVWLSPRAYVEYFLPPNGSAAMLSAYALWRCRQKHLGWPLLLAAWIVAGLLMACLKPLNISPWLTLGAAATWYWTGFVCLLIAFVVSLALCLALRRPRHLRPRGAILAILTIIISLWSIGLGSLRGGGRNVAEFQKRVADLIERRRAGGITSWEYIGQWIEANSSPQDKIYVWGWFPGIYVAAQRFSPAKEAAYSDMHTDAARWVKGRIDRLVKQFQADPPRYIIDSQKMHYPFNLHPVFDLWLHRRDQDGRVQFFPGRRDVIDSVNPQKNQWVEDQTFMLLTRGGSLSPAKARAQAQAERIRHENMLPLREFVMLNYRPVTLPVQSNMFVFKYKGP